MNTEMISARMTGILASSREAISTETLFSYDFFTLDLQASHSSRPARLQVECSEGNEVVSDVIILDGCAILWTLPWPLSSARVFTFFDAKLQR